MVQPAASISRTLGRYVHGLDYDALPPAVVDKIKASLLHALVVAILGERTAHGQSAIALVKAEETKPDGATVLIDGAKATRSVARHSPTAS